uniref:Uncharacterized protein n=1 Tax=Rhizophora mucronata TaxID=61149 RepID=A0A2P2NSZ7_RHIMU
MRINVQQWIVKKIKIVNDQDYANIMI